jgi:hypothetical protein
VCSKEDDPSWRDTVVPNTEDERGRMRVAAMHANAEAERDEARRARVTGCASWLLAAIFVALAGWLFIASAILVLRGS